MFVFALTFLSSLSSFLSRLLARSLLDVHSLKFFVSSSKSRAICVRLSRNMFAKTSSLLAQWLFSPPTEIGIVINRIFAYPIFSENAKNSIPDKARKKNHTHSTSYVGEKIYANGNDIVVIIIIPNMDSLSIIRCVIRGTFQNNHTKFLAHRYSSAFFPHLF